MAALARHSKLNTYYLRNNLRKGIRVNKCVNTRLHALFYRYNAILIYHPCADFKYALRTISSFQYYKYLACMKIAVQIGIYELQLSINTLEGMWSSQSDKQMTRGTVAQLEVGILNVLYKTLALCVFMTY